MPSPRQPGPGAIAEPEVRFVGGMRYRARGGVPSGRPNLSWPLAELEVSAERVRIAPRRTALGVIEFEPSEIDRVESGFGISRAGFRFRCHDHRDGIVFWARGRDFAVVADALRRLGLEIVPAPWFTPADLVVAFLGCAVLSGMGYFFGGRSVAGAVLAPACALILAGVLRRPPS
jgi:hypothetical protein